MGSDKPADSRAPTFKHLKSAREQELEAQWPPPGSVLNDFYTRQYFLSSGNHFNSIFLL